VIDLFYPPMPTTRHGRVVALLTPADELQPQKRSKGRDPARNKARQARYRAKMQADAVRYARHLEACKAWHQDNREEALAGMKARRQRLATNNP
jgi:hypothetical protein